MFSRGGIDGLMGNLEAEEVAVLMVLEIKVKKT